MAPSLPKVLFLLFAIMAFPRITFSSNSSTNTMETHLSSIRSLCKTTPYPTTCFDSLKLSININILPNILNFLLQTLEGAISEAGKLSDILSTAGQSNIIEKQRGSVQDCKELHQITISSLQKSVSRIKSNNPKKLSDARAYLSAALTNKNTCLEGLDTASGPLKPILVNSFVDTYKQVSNSLSILSKPGGSPKGHKNRRLLGFPSWLSRKTRRILQTSGDEFDPSEVLTVAGDGSGNFTTISDAVNFAPNNSYDRVIIYIKEGVYKENVDIPSYKTNVVFFGDGSDVTFITGNRSHASGWTTFRSATVAVSGEGFLARDITIENSAGAEAQQAVALRINADFAAIYKSVINGYQDTLYTHSFRQFYRECDIYGTIDYIFGNAAVVFQACNIVSKMPLSGQFTVITAQSRDTPDEFTGISIQNCSILASNDLYASSVAVKSYLGRPWRVFAQTVVLESFIDDFIDPVGWIEWPGGQGLDTLYFGEYENYGPGSGTEKRVGWPGYHVMEYDDAYNFTVSEFIAGDAWLGSTSFPYDDGI
ncbi:hypothetical protein UlMin_021872 [Ulmus minor]